MIVEIAKPYLLLIGDMEDPSYAKTALGLGDWTPEACRAQLRFSKAAVDLGLPEMTPAQAALAGCKTLVIGIAPRGGALPPSWYPTLIEALESGLDIASGLHQRLTDVPELAVAAARYHRRLFDVRHSPAKFDVATGARRGGRRLLTVGTDCALGKKYTALAIARAMRNRGWAVDFRATGQTGILISGSGVAVDAVVADFVAGAAEALSPVNSADHWDVIEGQGSLFHPSYAGVSLGLLHGSQPDALVLCHDPSRKSLSGLPHYPVVSPEEAIDFYLRAGALTNPDVRFVGIALNTAKMDDSEAIEVMRVMSERLGLPCVDPIRGGVEPIMAVLEKFDGH